MREEVDKGGRHGADFEPDRAVSLIAEGQHGVVAIAQLYAVGLGPNAVASRVRAGRLNRVYRGICVVGHKRLSREGRWLVAVLACGPHAVLSHRSAAGLPRVRAGSGARSRAQARGVDVVRFTHRQVADEGRFAARLTALVGRAGRSGS